MVLGEGGFRRTVPAGRWWWWCLAVLLSNGGGGRAGVAATLCGLCSETQSAAPISAAVALCLLRSGTLAQGPITSAALAASTHLFCNTTNTHTDVIEGNTGATQSQLFTQWNGNSQCLCLAWNPASSPSDTAPGHGVLYLVDPGPRVQGAAFSGGNLYATFSNSMLLLGVNRTTPDTDRYVIGALSANGSISVLTTSAVAVPGRPDNAALHQQYFDDAQYQAFRTLTWQRGSDGISGERYYELNFAATATFDRATGCVDFARSGHAGESLDLRLLSDLRYYCTYSVVIRPVVPTGVLQLPGIDVSERLSLRFNFNISYGLATATLNYEPYGAPLDCQRAFNFSGDVSGRVAVNGSSLVYAFDLQMLNSTRLTLPFHDVLASLDVFELQLIKDGSASLFVDGNIDLYAQNGRMTRKYSSGEVLDPGHYHFIATIEIRLDRIIMDRLLFGVNRPKEIPSLTCGVHTYFTHGLAETGSPSTLSPVSDTLPTTAATVALPTSLPAGGTAPPQSEHTPSLPVPVAVAPNASLRMVIVIAIVAPVSILVVAVVVVVLLLKWSRRVIWKEIERKHRTSVQSNQTVITQLGDEYEVLPGRLQLLDVVGSGAFGVVRRARLHETAEWRTETSRLVAVKTLHSKGDETDRQDLLREISQMKEFGHHPHLVTLIGCCTLQESVCLVAEWMPHGSMAQVLRQTKRLVTAEALSPGPENMASKLQIKVTPCGHIYAEEICRFGAQIASGMEHLSKLRYIHRDLAARNILVGEGNVVKVADFGMTRDVYSDPRELYVKSGRGPAPLKWMAPEAIRIRQFSTRTDVWAFGVVLWEICTFASRLPYSDVPNDNLYEYLKSGRRLQRPPGCPAPLYELMKRCWQFDPYHRPLFHELHSILRNFTESLYDSVEDRVTPTFSFNHTASADFLEGVDTDQAYMSGNTSMATGHNTSNGNSALMMSSGADSGYAMGTDYSNSDTSYGDRFLAPPPRYSRKLAVVEDPSAEIIQHRLSISGQVQLPCNALVQQDVLLNSDNSSGYSNVVGNTSPSLRASPALSMERMSLRASPALSMERMHSPCSCGSISSVPPSPNQKIVFSVPPDDPANCIYLSVEDVFL